MQTLLVTLFIHEQSMDVKVPIEVPISELISSLLHIYRPTVQDKSRGDPTHWGLGYFGSDAPFFPSQTLFEVGVLQGNLLVLKELPAWKQRPQPFQPQGSIAQKTLFHIPARDYPPRLKDEEIVIIPPPMQEQKQGGAATWVQAIVPIVGTLGGALFMVTSLVSRAGGNSALFLVLAIALPVITIGTSLATNFVKRWVIKKQQRTAHNAYMDYLGVWRVRLRELADQQHQINTRLYPNLPKLVELVKKRQHLWERRSEDHDFLDVSIGRGPTPLHQNIRFELQNDPMTKYDPELRARAEALIADYHHIDEEPTVIPLRTMGTLTIAGSLATARALVRSMLCQVITFQSPKDVRIVTFFPQNSAHEWSWLKWLPHTQRLRHIKTGKNQLSEALCLLADNPVDCTDILVNQIKPELERRRKLSEDNQQELSLLPHLLLVIDSYTLQGPLAQIPELYELMRDAEKLGATVICVVADQGDEPSETNARITITPDEWVSFEVASYGGRRLQGIVPNKADVANAEDMARSLAPIIVAGEGSDDDLSQDVRLLDLLDIHSAELVNTSQTWHARERETTLRVPVGQREKSKALIVDLKEASEKGDGPHGLVIGATGSGKSELLRTLVISQAIAHDPHTVNFVFVDFKGGASFADLANLPHVAGMVTNLENEPSLIDRMRDSLQGELRRRQTMLREAGNLDNVQQYQAKWRTNPKAMKPMPHLLLIVDEFAELLANRSDFLDLFITIGRVGRSLGIHLLLATQRLEEGRLKGLESYIRYRICLRTFSAAESTTVLGRPDAYYLPSAPGVGYLKIDANTPVRFKTALITSPYIPGNYQVSTLEMIREFSPAGHLIPSKTQIQVSQKLSELDNDNRTEMDMVIARLAKSDTPRPNYYVHQVWLDPLDKNVLLGNVISRTLKTQITSGDLGRLWHDAPPFGTMTIPVGLVDVPLDQKQRPLNIDFSGTGGHLAIVGAPQTGKSTLLRTLITSFIMTHSPRDVQIYGIDMGGGQLRLFESTPHVGAVCGKGEREKTRLLIRLMFKIIADREALFRDNQVESMASYRARRQAGELADAPFGDVFLIIDNLAQFLNDFENLEADLTTLIATGLTYGVHIVVTANRWPEIRPKLRDNIGTRLELRINDPMESEIDRRKAAELPVGIPGRGLNKDKLMFQVCQPWIQGTEKQASLQEALTALIQRTQAWRGPGASPIVMLPPIVERKQIRRAQTEPTGALLGLEEFKLDPVYIDLTTMGPHFLVLGDAESGKTNLLRQWITDLATRYTPDQVRIAAIESRTTTNLFDITKLPHFLTYASMRMPSSVKEAVDTVSKTLKERSLPTTFTSIYDLAKQSSWQGPHYFLFVDDYEAIATPSGSPLTALRDQITQARDIGFHLILTRSVGGMAGASFEPIIKSLREMGSPGLIMSGERSEGKVLHDQMAAPMPVGRGTFVRRKFPPTQIQIALAR
ncbi:MAG TPA: type VII secretion protein EccCa [Dictyobacter sp.]|jgi:S-DNA-T family DNA segregation ATPase FtsK/SpoIIIE|nr:type VII secretion protein EccCa [Dictyobacter sp.]